MDNCLLSIAYCQFPSSIEFYVFCVVKKYYLI
jgi:hypothetical protein